MKIILQRVKGSSVTVNGRVIAEIEQGLLLLVGFGKDDQAFEPAQIAAMMDKAIEKIIHLRVFSNLAGKLDHSVLDIQGSILAVPQFTLYGQALKGRRPDFALAMSPDEARHCFDLFVSKLKLTAVNRVVCGEFGADMAVKLVNDGPFTLSLDY